MMLLGCYPRLLALALSLPESAHALGLGNIRVDSGLNEPLAAQIDIIGATADELKALNASVANPEIFARYRAERPAFLSSASIMVGLDAQGRPVLNVHSTESFTEPLVDFLVDLRWGNEELLRDYTLLLDPPKLAPANLVNVAATAHDDESLIVQLPVADLSDIVATATAVSFPTPVLPTPGTNVGAFNAGAQYRVVAHDTLRAIAWHAGAHSEADQQRMMIAIFQANRDAFEGNINRLHRGALLTIPSTEEIRAINGADAEREVRAQLTAWRGGGRSSARRAAFTPAVAPSALTARPAPISTDAEMSTMLSAMNRLEGRVQWLQQALNEASQHLADATARIDSMEQSSKRAVAAPSAPAKPKAQASSGKKPLNAMTLGLALLFGGMIYACRRFLPGWARLRKSSGSEQPVGNALAAGSAVTRAAPTATGEVDWELTPQQVVRVESDSPSAAMDRERPEDEPTVEITQPVEIDVDAVDPHGSQAGDEHDTVALKKVHVVAADGTSTALDYNLADLDGHGQHVEMPGSLHEHAVVVERRKNVVDSLKAAIQRDPSRSDLRMKLLETLYTTAAGNLRVFKETVRELTRHPERLTAEQWQQVMEMGREIAAADALFANSSEDDVADCA